jgi:hypothetical protein
MDNYTQRIVNKAWSYAHLLRDECLEDAAGLPEPDVIPEEIAEDLQSALDQFAAIANDLKLDR